MSRAHHVVLTLTDDERNLVRWITDPQGVEPGTAMPDLDVSGQEARHIAAYLLKLEQGSAWRGVMPPC